MCKLILPILFIFSLIYTQTIPNLETEVNKAMKGYNIKYEFISYGLFPFFCLDKFNDTNITITPYKGYTIGINDNEYQIAIMSVLKDMTSYRLFSFKINRNGKMYMNKSVMTVYTEQSPGQDWSRCKRFYY